MTNREKFKEVFGFEQDGNPCVAPQEVCNHEDWRLPAYEVIGQLLATVVCLAVGFLIITR